MWCSGGCLVSAQVTVPAGIPGVCSHLLFPEFGCNFDDEIFISPWDVFVWLEIGGL